MNEIAEEGLDTNNAKDAMNEFGSFNSPIPYINIFPIGDIPLIDKTLENIEKRQKYNDKLLEYLKTGKYPDDEGPCE